MTKKIFQSIILAAGCVLIAGFVIILGCLYAYFGNLQEDQIRDELSLAAIAVSEDGTDYLSKIDSDRFRMTWVAADGKVLYDTETDAETLENHAERDEIKEALTSGSGESIRYSSTLLENTMYCAKRLDDGSVLRISVSRASVGALLSGMIWPVLFVLIAALALSALLANRLSKKIVAPLNALDLEHPLENDAYEELSPLLGRINRQHKQISDQLGELQRKTDEFDHITRNMREGLVLLNNDGCVLSINPAAQKLFGTDADCIGRDFLTVDRSRDMSDAVRRAMSKGHSELRAEHDGLIYRFNISRIDSSGVATGAVILAFDVTEQENAEQSRREFTANVSHELKTPLQGIIGSAELIENGMVKPEDLPRFVGHIRTEAQRLVTLIKDIIRLSQLDEQVDMPREDFDMLDIANETAEDLRDAAAAKDVTVTVSGCSVKMNGVRRLIYETIYNLCDNAIKYNKAGGRVSICVEAADKNAAVTVSDNGIGIAPEQQSRVFERFYRVDKSHSKSSGGTGLGLSIVKHAVQYHGGTVELKSEPGEGTSIRLTLPTKGTPESDSENI